ncbi:phosphotransferase [Synechococcus sp. CC9311]|uniref:phosphotransferase n=1 Tax=Synechococcus sp. (strain CC9311) TaxID=64471 RepID=UPI0000DDA9CC|nr:phosphotransferase [Synechococcus sp. CC9311]ABI45968.1 hypothetical protein sync_0186 [Synechococcus sp. CC9311]
MVKQENSKRKIAKLALACSSPGGAALIKETIGYLAKKRDIEIEVVMVEEPAWRILENVCKLNNIRAAISTNARYTKHESDKKQEYMKWVLETIGDAQIDAVITGLSGLDMGVDETLQLIGSRQRKIRYTLQDTPGWVVDGIAGPSPTYFVQIAGKEKEMTEKGVHRSICVGELKMKEMKYKAERLLKKVGQNEITTNRVLFIGQPLWQLQGYRKTLEKLHSVVADLGKDGIDYVSHPLEGKEQAIASGLVKVTSRGLLELVLEYKYIVTCFSTGLKEAAMINMAAKRKLPRLIYAIGEKDVRASYVENGQSISELVKDSWFAEVIDRELTLGDFKTEIWGNKTIEFSEPKTEEIYKTIVRDYKKRLFLPKNYAADSQLDTSRRQLGSSHSWAEEIREALRKCGLGEANSEIRRLSTLHDESETVYIRGNTKESGNIFIKLIDTREVEQTKNALLMVQEIGEGCAQVETVLTKDPVYIETKNKYMAVTQWIDSTEIDCEDEDNLKKIGSALGLLHKRMKTLVFKRELAIERQRWIVDAWHEVAKTDLLEKKCSTLSKKIKEEISKRANRVSRETNKQFIHGDLNKGNILCTRQGGIIFIDFEEATSSWLPFYVDLAIVIERLCMLSGRNSIKRCRVLLSEYFKVVEWRLPRVEALNDGRAYAIARSFGILSQSRLYGLDWPEYEWTKFCKLTKHMIDEKKILRDLSVDFTN